MKNILAFLLVPTALFRAGCNTEQSVVVANGLKPTPHKEAGWNSIDKNFHYQSYPDGYKGIRFVQYRIHIPQNDGTTKLKIETNFNLRYKFKSGNQDRCYRLSVEAATEAVKRLLKASPQSFPPNTKIVKAYDMGPGEPRITFNSQFADAKWWQNSKRAQATITSLVQTANETQDFIHPMSGDSSLTIFVQDKPVGRIGKYYLSLPLYDGETKQVDNEDAKTITTGQRQQYENNKNYPRR